MKKSLPTQSLELAISAPQVINQRLAKMVAGGLNPSPKDMLEVHRMWHEKFFAFHESWYAMCFEAAKYQQQLLACTVGYWSAPWLLPQALVKSSVKHAPAASEKILRKGLEPIHNRTVANVRRLSNKK